MYEDYSLMKIRNRLAVEGEELVAHKFRSGSIGMVSRSDFRRWQTAAQAELGPASPAQGETTNGFWQSIKNFFMEFLTFYGFVSPVAQSSDGEPGPVVAIPSEALLRVFGISPELQRQYHLSLFEDALFTEMWRSGLRQDGLCFGNGVTIPLQQLREGQKVKVLRRSWAESLDPDPEPARVKA
jgi:hypothetical protein